jgi:hypothetical protein
MTLLAASLALFLSSAPGGCKPATLDGASTSDDGATFEGEGALGLGAQTFPVTWTSTITSTVQNEDGSLALTGSHHIEGANASIDFTTSDAVLATPTAVPGVFDFTNRLTVVDAATGRVRGGFLDVVGTVNLLSGEVQLTSSSGELCARR